MPNRVYTDLSQLRRDTNDLIDRGRVRVHHHARSKHPEFTDVERIAVVRYGGRISFDRSHARSEGRYVCWGRLEGHGLCRAVFCMEEQPSGDLVIVISGFVE